ncbi:chloride channel protein [Propionibacterium freudenreichii]|uniref:chloride channel protein n=1 Tax=Propionibacterium freudenreichii TaxID=1744 RepID=UPI000541EFAC|nr:chloride channel protein [Propionibacterium freudenreichii]MDK9302613.1 chloride channel protein [Propionibacterium freudenreichii]MDK9644050.1 chloride channel protein [Propionibacterium freudenreichii]MDK9649387.1 chloride channel protein [Propionibacterium freudenreichii]CEG87135.1 Chloride channel protein [Propionibacterium freudenreichii]CEI23491.1 Chloride channel protein [Propionibacterium freudenreichii]
MVVLIVVAGVVAGVIGGLTAEANRLIETLAFGFDFTKSPNGPAGAPWWRRLLVALLGGVACGLIWMRIRPRPGGNLVGVKGASTDPTGTKRLPPLATVLDAFAQMLIVGTGISQGREPAPRQYAAVAAQALARRFRVDVATRGLLIAATAGAGLASVYNVPLAGALYALEEVVRPNLRTRRGWWQVAVAVIISALSTAVSWLFNHRARTYVMPQVRVDVHAYAWAALIAVVALVVGFAFQRALAWIKAHEPDTRRLWWTVPIGAVAVAAIGLWNPQIPGNGQVLVQTVLTGGLLPGALLIACVAKFGATLLSFGAGSNGGVLTPSLAVGASLTMALMGWCHVDAAVGVTVAVVGAACVLTLTQHSPMFSAMFALELTGSGLFTSSAVAWGVGLTWALYLLLPRLARRLRRRGPSSADA